MVPGDALWRDAQGGEEGVVIFRDEEDWVGVECGRGEAWGRRARILCLGWHGSTVL